MKRISTIYLLLLLVLQLHLSYAEQPYNTGWAETFDTCICVSGQYTYVATGQWDYLTSWTPEWYEIDVIYNGTPKMQHLNRRFYGDIHMIPWQNGVLIINQLEDGPCSYHIDYWELKNGNTDINFLHREETSQLVNDFVFYNDALILLTDYSIYLFDTNTFQRKLIYNTNYEITNQSYNNRSFVYHDDLFISDNHGRIIMLDLLNFEWKILVNDYCTNEMEEMKYSEIYGYIIVKEDLYYYDANQAKTVVHNIKDGSSKVLFEGKTSFSPDENENIIITAYKEKRDQFAGTYIGGYILSIIDYAW